MNKEWHQANVLDRNASPDQRVAWHLEHQKQCGCRPIPASVQRLLQPAASTGQLRSLLTGGDRRSIASSQQARALVEQNKVLVSELAALTADDDWLVAQRALDLLEKLAHVHNDWVMPYRNLFIGPLADSDKWEIRLQIVRALPLFRWAPAQAGRVEAILRDNITFPQTFVRAWALDSLATIAQERPALMPLVRRHLSKFEKSDSKALQARARQIRSRLLRST